MFYNTLCREYVRHSVDVTRKPLELALLPMPPAARLTDLLSLTYTYNSVN